MILFYILFLLKEKFRHAEGSMITCYFYHMLLNPLPQMMARLERLSRNISTDAQVFPNIGNQHCLSIEKDVVDRCSL